MILTSNKFYLPHITVEFQTLYPLFRKFIKNPPISPIFTNPPPWLLPNPLINLELTNLTKPTNPSIVQQNFFSCIQKYPNHSLCFTDGSKTNQGVGSAYSINQSIHSSRLPDYSSIFTAELFAILSCVEDITRSRSSSKFLILSDSLSSLTSLKNLYSKNPIIQRIQLLLHACISSNILIQFLWIPSHSNISGNDTVDSAAKSATMSRYEIQNTYLHSDIKSNLRSEVYNQWLTLWKSQSSNHLRKIKPSISKWKSSCLKSRKKEIVLTRLRISHTNLTHSYLICGQDPPSCPLCRNPHLSIDHILTSCPKLTPLYQRLHLPPSVAQILDDSSSHLHKVFLLLNHIHLLNEI